MELLGRAAILAAPDLPTVDVPVPEWGGTVRIRSMSAAERDDFEAETYALRGPDGATNLANIRARLLARCAVDAEGTPLFTAADAGALGKKSAAAVDRCVAMAQKLNGLSAQDVEALLGNSGAGQVAPSASGSPASSG